MLSVSLIGWLCDITQALANLLHALAAHQLFVSNGEDVTDAETLFSDWL